MATRVKPRTTIEPSMVLNSQVAQALVVLGDRWAFLIIRDAYLGVRRFEELRKRTGSARGTLSSRLRKLVQHGILYRNPYQNTPARYEYRLTDKGLDLYPLVLATWNWETKWGDGDNLPPELIHKTCGKFLRPRYRCGHCHAELKLHDVSFATDRNAASAKKIPPRFQRRSQTKGGSDPKVDRRFFRVIDVIGDRWTGLVVASAYFGVKRFDDIVSSIGIATNILSNRLNLLLHAGVLVRKPYQDRPPRHEYLLSEKGQQLHPILIAMHEWANKWLIGDSQQPLNLHHKLCDKPLSTELVCSECDESLWPRDVTFARETEQRQAI